MPTIVDFNCATGKAASRDMTADETSAHQQLQTAVQQNNQARQDDMAKREATLNQLAQKVGMPIDLLKHALQINQPQTAPDRRP